MAFPLKACIAASARWQRSAALRRDAAQHRLLTAAPVSLERLHLCCKGSCEFIEGSLRTVLLRKPHHRKFSFFGIFRLENAGLYSAEPPQKSRFLKKSDVHRCALAAKFKPGNGDFDR